MSLFVQLPPADYSRTAFDRFRPLRGGFDLDDARAMMWMSQLAYETDAPQTIADIGPLWGFKPIDPVRVQAQRIDTRVIVGEREDCIVAAFAGTDPALDRNLMTDADCRLTLNDTHEGFQAALDAAWPQVETKLTALNSGAPAAGLFHRPQPRRGPGGSGRRESQRRPFGAGRGLYFRHAAGGRRLISNPATTVPSAIAPTASFTAATRCPASPIPSRCSGRSTRLRMSAVC